MKDLIAEIVQDVQLQLQQQQQQGGIITTTDVTGVIPQDSLFATSHATVPAIFDVRYRFIKYVIIIIYMAMLFLIYFA